VVEASLPSRGFFWAITYRKNLTLSFEDSPDDDVGFESSVITSRAGAFLRGKIPIMREFVGW
jgi:hypothetical protein